MPYREPRLSTPRPSLFWRTFLLLVALIIFSVVGWLQSFRVLSELPYSQGIAKHIVSTANLTRYALVSADPIFRPDLLKILAAREHLLISLRNPTDEIDHLPEDGFNTLIEQLVKNSLGQQTVLASRVNGLPGLWVSVSIEGDDYWIMTRADLLDPPYGTNWVWWAFAAALASLLGATLLTQHVIQPLAQLASFAKDFGQGKTPKTLPEEGCTAEIQAVNVSFNRMVHDLQRAEADRELLLAGVSHDLRTPITRLRLELELANLPEDSREAMVSDLEQMENIVNQFLNYVRRSNETQRLIDFGEAVQDAINQSRIGNDPTVELNMHLDRDLKVFAGALELSRAVQNLLTNAMRYGRSEDDVLYMTVRLSKTKDGKHAVLTVADQGDGLPEDQRARIMRPFERGESARTGVTGSGLGLSIVERIVRRSGGSVELDSVVPHGLLIRLIYPISNPTKDKKLPLAKNILKKDDQVIAATTEPKYKPPFAGTDF